MGLRRTKPALSLPKGWMKMTPPFFIPIGVFSIRVPIISGYFRRSKMYPQRDEHDWDEHHWHEQEQIKQLVTNRNDITPWKGAKLGTLTASTLVLGYSLVMTLFSSFFTPGFGVVLLIGVATGIVPAMLVGLLGGGVLGAIYESKPEPYNSRTAWMIGGGIGLIPIILYGLFVFRSPSGPIYEPSTLERFAAGVFFLILPGIITVGAFGWISQKLNRQIRPAE